MVKKSYFRERTADDIRGLATKPVYSERGLVERIAGLDMNKESLELRVKITPGNFFLGGLTGTEASRKFYKHGDLVALSQPATQQEACSSLKNPMEIIAEDLSRLAKMREETIDFIGYSFRPVQGRDRRKRVVPFVWIYEANRLHAYSENNAGGIKLEPYVDSGRVKKEGGEIVCFVPSRTKKQLRYKIRLKHIPVENTPERKAIVWSFKANYENGESGHSLYNIRYTWENDRESSDILTIYPHEIAADFKVMKFFFEKHRYTPFEMNPFLTVSKEGVEYYKRLCNNLLIYDPTLTSEEKTRKLHLDEKCILLARSIGVLGPEKVMWNYSRDGKLQDYDWSIGNQDSQKDNKN